MQAANHRRSPLVPVEVVDVPTVLAVHAMRNSGEPCRQYCVEPGEIARMNDRRLQVATEPIKVPAKRPNTHARAMQGNHLDIGSPQPITKLREILDANHSMAETRL